MLFYSNRFCLLLLISTLLLLQSCTVASRISAYPINIKQTRLVELSSTQQQIKHKLEQAYVSWQGTPYGYGSQQPGVAADCSGFTQSVFKNQLAINLPRTTEQQINIGKKINIDDAKAGDLVFFNLSNGYGHVGIYLTDNQIMQATSSKGVTKTNLNTSQWWKDRVFLVKRVIR